MKLFKIKIHKTIFFTYALGDFQLSNIHKKDQNKQKGAFYRYFSANFVIKYNLYHRNLTSKKWRMFILLYTVFFFLSNDFKVDENDS